MVDLLVIEGLVGCMNRSRHSSLLSIALFLFPTSARAQFVIDYEGDRFCSQQSEVSLIDAASWT